MTSAGFLAVAFDFDGTLVDSYGAIAASVNHVRATHGLAPLAEVEVRKFVGRGPAYLLQNTVPGADLERDWPCYRKHHPSVMFSHTHLLPGAAETLRQLKELGRPVAICSNKPRLFTRQLLDHLQLSALVAAVFGPEDVPRPKPAPDMLLAALKRLNVVACDLLYVGDMVVDVETARAAGVTVWVVPTGNEDRAALEASQPDRLLRDLNDVRAAFDGSTAVSVNPTP